MPSRNIAVQQVVYEALRREKRAGESFTALFRRLLEQKGNLETLHGVWGKVGIEGDRAHFQMFRTPLRRRL
ncbi:MAG: antitoxin VapB family protein [Thermoplasmata archaeon]